MIKPVYMWMTYSSSFFLNAIVPKLDLSPPSGITDPNKQENFTLDWNIYEIFEILF